MNSRERMLTAAKGGKPDQVPAAPYIGNFGAALMGVPISRYNTDGKTMADTQTRAYERHGLDVVLAQSDNYYIAEGFGTVTAHPENDTPHVVKNAIDSLDDVDKLKVPDPYTDGRMPVYIEAVTLLKERFKNDVAVRGCGTGPFSLAGHILGMENLLIEMATCEAEEDEEAEKKIFQLMALATDALTAFSIAILKAGSDFVICGNSAASPDLVSAAYYRKYIFPFEQRFFSAVKDECNKRGAVSLLHICGDTTSILPFMAQTGADILEIDYKVDLAKARELVGDKVCLMGNLNPTAVLLQGSTQDVSRESLACIEKAGKNGAFILGSGCEVAPKTPLENILALRDTARGYRY